MALPATDTFTNSDGTALTTHSANWTLNDGNFDIQSNALAANDAIDCFAHWNADAFANDQYASATITALASDTWIGVAVRCSTSGGVETAYVLYTDSNDAMYLSKYVTGTYTALGATFSIPSVNDKIKLEVVGTTLEYFKDTGGGWVSQGTRTDSAIASGSAGVSGYGTSINSRIDDWEGGNISGAATPKGPLGSVLVGALGGPI